MNDRRRLKSPRAIIRPALSGSRAAVIGTLLVLADGALAHNTHTIPFVTPASNTVQQTFVRIINREERGGTIEIRAIDDSGTRHGPVTLTLGPKATVHLNSGDLEAGNPGKGLPLGVGDGEGNWRLELDTALDIEPLGYIRTVTGFVTPLHDVVEDGIGAQHHVVFFNPARNTSQRSLLRIVNLSNTRTEVEIAGRDDKGAVPEESVRFTLEGDAARILSAADLENGAEGLVGKFGRGSGKWQLFVTASARVLVMNLMESATGNLSNLSRTTARPEPGRFRFIRTGADRGTITVTGGPITVTGGSEDSFCKVNLQFSSTTTGTIVPVAVAKVHAEDFAPANRAEFEKLFENVRSSYSFSGGRFTISSYGGTYEYRKLWPNAAGLLLSHDDRRGYAYDEKCTVIATFESAQAGNFAAWCNECTLSGCEDEYHPPQRWEITGWLSGLAPADNDAFNDDFCGKRLTITDVDDSTDPEPDYYIEFIDTGVLRTSRTLLATRRTPNRTTTSNSSIPGCSGRAARCWRARSVRARQQPGGSRFGD